MTVLRVVLLVTVCSASLCVAQESDLIPFRIQDQFDREHTAADLEHRVFVLVGSDKRGSRYQGAWVDRLRAAFADDEIPVVEVADLRGVPFFIRGSVKKKFPQEKRSWVLLDWKGELAKAYRFKPDKCSILVFDEGGRLVYQNAAEGLQTGMLDEIVDATGALLRERKHGP